jgi:predicted DNA-binding antitoxin AbrB/MazE fold protein
MKGLQIEAVYANGLLKLPRQLPLAEGQKVTITIHPPGGVVQRSYGLLHTTLSAEELERIGRDPEFGILESQRGTAERVPETEAGWSRRTAQEGKADVETIRCDDEGPGSGLSCRLPGDL